MNRRRFAFVALVSFALGIPVLVVGQDEQTPVEVPDQIEQPAPSDQPAPAIFSPQGSVITPDSSVMRPEDAGRYAHTNHLIFVPQGGPLASIMPSFTLC